MDVRVGKVVVLNRLEAEELFRINRSGFHPPRLHLHQDWPHSTTAYQHAVRHSFVVVVVDVAVPVGFVSVKDATAGIIHRWRTVSHRRLRLKMTVRHCVVQHRRGLDATSVKPTVATRTSIVKTFLQRCSQVKFSYRSRSRKTSFGVRVRANGLRLFLRARAGSGPLTPRGKSQSTQTWKPTNNQVAQTLITASSEIAPTAESKLSSSVKPLTEPTSDEQAVMVSLFSARIVESNSPIVNATIRNVSCRILMDTRGQVSVLPLSLCQKLKPPVNLPVPNREIATYGNNTVKFHGPVPLHMQLCGLTILHPFYICLLYTSDAADE